ncbi:870_t:CDS:2 [Entrophospora sp. SA101]|nr:9535_t:CDS:2 [Entrophospora sp. SA101]CAJ0649727.1 870_t:CDS:2 [Entrophospora sp. SA101]
MVTFATDYWAPALDSKARRRMTDLEGRAVQAMKKNLSRSTVASNSTSITSTTSQSFNYPYHNNNPRRNNSLPVVNAINPIQTPFQHNKPVIISSRGSAGTSPKNIIGSYINHFHDNKADEHSICSSIEIVPNNNDHTNGHTEHKKKNLVQSVQKLFIHDSKVNIQLSPKEELEEFNFKNSHDNSLLLKKYGVCDKSCIGKGATAVVRLHHKFDNSECERTYAVKEFRKKRKNESEKDYVKKLTSEFCISSTLHHVNIVKTVDFLQDDNHNWCEVMEYCAGGDLYSAIKASHMTSVEINCCFKQLIMGISYLHSMGVAHRTCWEEEVHFSKGLCGSEPYIAPEQFETKEYDARLVDIWACGIVYYCMIYQGIPFRMATPADPNYANYLETKNLGLYEPFERLPRGCRDLMFRILEPDTKLRIRIEEIKNDAWFKTIESCSEFDEPEPESELESSKSTKSSSEPSSRKRTLTQEHKHLPPTCLKEIQEKDGKNGAKDNHNDKDN